MNNTPDIKELENDSQRAEENQKQLRTAMMTAINSILDKKSWNQTEMASTFNVTQPRISNLRNNQADKFSTDALLSMLMILGYKIDFGHIPATGRGADKIQFHVTLAR